MHRTTLLLLLGVLALSGVACGHDAAAPKNVVPHDFSISPQAGRPPLNFAPTSIAPETVLFENATVFTISGETLEKGNLLMEGGQIVQVSADKIEAPEGATVIDARGKFLTPGIIDTHSHMGVYATPFVRAHSDGNEATAPTTPDIQAVHGIWPQDPNFYKALSGGITSIMVIPGSANLIGGRGVILKMHPGISSRAMQLQEAMPGLKMACGENPKRVYGNRGGKPSTRMGSMAVWRATFQAAQEYQRKLEKYEREWLTWNRSADRAKAEKEPQPPARDLGKETLVAVMNGEILVHVHCYRADEMIQVLQLAEEFGFHVRSFHHAVEAYKIRDVLAEWDVSVSTWADWWGFKIEANDAILQNAALLHEAGARAIIHSDSEVFIQRLNQEASKAYYAGLEAGIKLTEEDALRWVTLNAAWALGIDHLTGSLEVGKQADVVLWDKHPLSVYAKPDLVFVDGVREFDATKKAPWSDFEVQKLPENIPFQ